MASSAFPKTNKEFDDSLILDLTPNLEASLNVGKHVILGKLLCFKPMKKTLLRNILHQMWDPAKWRMEELKQGIFAFHFSSAEDCTAILDRRPWNVNRSHLILKE